LIKEIAMLLRHTQSVPAQPIEAPGCAAMTARFALTKTEGCPRYAMRLIEFGPGGQTSRHAHAEEHEFYFLEGEGAIVDAEGLETRILAGDFVYVPPHEVHQLKNTGASPLKVLCTIPILGDGDGRRTAADAR
jgi:quercetin dioxygenase-like cupin family protein